MKTIFKNNKKLFLIIFVEIIIFSSLLYMLVTVSNYKKAEVKVKAKEVNYGNATVATLRNTLKDLYPVGSIYISVSNINPAATYGGTWEAFGTGRTLVGVDTSQTEFDTVEETGGSKYMPQHTHSFYAAWLYRDTQGYRYASGRTNSTASAGGSSNNWNFDGAIKWTSGPGSTITISGNSGTGGSGDSGNLAPYITVYMWKKTSDSGSPVVGTCRGCVYAYYTDTKVYGPYGSTLTNYTTDYTTLVDSVGNQRPYFLGHILDNDGKILRAYSCGVLNIGYPSEKVICLEHTPTGTSHTQNSKILKSLYHYFNSDKYECHDYTGGIHCTGSLIGYSNEAGHDDGGVGFYGGGGGCTIDLRGMYCYTD